jgi:MFS family permease
MRLAPARLSYLMWGLAAAFYLFGFFQRVTPASLAGDLMRDFKLTAAALGNLSAFYYYAYAAVQIPTGLLVDRYGPSRLLFVGAIVAGAGSLLFALAPDAGLAAAGRALIGAAHGLAWVSMLKLVSHWFPTARFGTMSGLSLAVGTLGAVLAGPPLRLAADAFGWRAVIAVSGVLALLLALAIRVLMRDDPQEYSSASHAPRSAPLAGSASALGGLVQVWRYRNTGLLFAVNSGVCGAFLTFTGLWGVPFLVQQHALTVGQASLLTSTMLVLFALGGPIFGHLSDRWRQRKRPYLLGAALMTAGFGTMAAAPNLRLGALAPLLLAAGFGAGSMALSFAYAKESVPPRLQGTVTGTINLGVMVGTLIQMPLIGWILDRYWDGRIENGVRLFSVEAFQAALLVLGAWVALALLLLLATRDTHARQNVEA